jgi:hypothetical protein
MIEGSGSGSIPLTNGCGSGSATLKKSMPIFLSWFLIRLFKRMRFTFTEKDLIYKKRVFNICCIVSTLSTVHSPCIGYERLNFFRYRQYRAGSICVSYKERDRIGSESDSDHQYFDVWEKEKFFKTSSDQGP